MAAVSSDTVNLGAEGFKGSAENPRIPDSSRRAQIGSTVTRRNYVAGRARSDQRGGHTLRKGSRKKNIPAKS